MRPLCKEGNHPIGHPKPNLAPSDLDWVASVAARDGVHQKGDGLLDWWSANACKKLKEMAERAGGAQGCDETAEDHMSLRTSGLDVHHAPKCSGLCYPCCNAQRFDCRC